MRILSWLLLLALLSPGCVRKRLAVPESLADKTRVANFGSIRHWGDVPSREMLNDVASATRQLAPRYAQAGEPAYLALSGGVDGGAYGAGFLCGWTEKGTRPEFAVVTGISTGALMAPLAFLGSEYDPVVREFYTSTELKDVARFRMPLGMLSADSIADTAPLAAMIGGFVDKDFLDRVAEAHESGRRLYVGTTNLDSQRPVIWNMGAIAERRDAEALELFRSVLLASASIPGAFQPVYVDVAAGHASYDEMHADGGLGLSVFLYGAAIDPLELRSHVLDRVNQHPTLYVIQNLKLGPDYAKVEPRTLPILKRTLWTLLKSHSTGCLWRLHGYAQRAGLDYRVTYLANDVPRRAYAGFEGEEMLRLFHAGCEDARCGGSWQRTPPD